MGRGSRDKSSRQRFEPGSRPWNARLRARTSRTADALYDLSSPSHCPRIAECRQGEQFGCSAESRCPQAKARQLPFVERRFHAATAEAARPTIGSRQRRLPRSSDTDPYDAAVSYWLNQPIGHVVTALPTSVHAPVVQHALSRAGAFAAHLLEDRADIRADHGRHRERSAEARPARGLPRDLDCERPGLGCER